MNIALAGGGTGGHLFPGLAVAEELRRLVSAGVLHERPSGGAIYYVCD